MGLRLEESKKKKREDLWAYFEAQYFNKPKSIEKVYVF